MQFDERLGTIRSEFVEGMEDPSRVIVVRDEAAAGKNPSWKCSASRSMTASRRSKLSNTEKRLPPLASEISLGEAPLEVPNSAMSPGTLAVFCTTRQMEWASV